MKYSNINRFKKQLFININHLSDMITTNEPKVNEGGRYSVMQACEALGIHRNTLRNYTEQGLIKCGFRRETGRKFYAGREIIRFWRAQL